MHNKILTLALLFLLPFLLTACSIKDLPVIGGIFGGKAGLGQAQTLTVWGLWEKPDVMGVLIKKYQETHSNITINYEDRSVVNANDYKDRIFTRAREKAEGADIVMVHNSWVPRLYAALTPMPAKLMTSQKYAELFYPSAVDSAVFQGKIYAAPAYYDGLVLLYNKKHFEEVGQRTPPTAWEEFRRLALQLSVYAGDGSNRTLIRAGAAIGNSSNIEHFSDILGLLFAQAGVKVPGDLDTKAAQDALVFYTNFVKEDGVWSDSFPEAVTAFAQEKVSMIFVPAWRIVDILAAAPDLDFGVAIVPQVSLDNPVSWASYWMYAVPNVGSKSAAAWDFLNFLMQEDQQLTLFSEASKTRPFGAAYSLKSLAAQLSSNVYLSPLLSTAPFGKSYEMAGRAGNKKQTDALKEVIDAIFTDSRAVPKDLLTKAKTTFPQ